MSGANKIKLHQGDVKQTPQTSRVHVSSLIKRMLHKHSDKISVDIRNSAFKFNRANSRKNLRRNKPSSATSPIFTSKLKLSSFGSGVFNQVSQRIKFRNHNTIEWKIGTDPLFPGSLAEDTHEDENIIQQYDKVFSNAIENIKDFANKELYSASVKINSKVGGGSDARSRLLDSNDKESKYLNNQIKKLSRNSGKGRQNSLSRIYRTVMCYKSVKRLSHNY